MFLLFTENLVVVFRKSTKSGAKKLRTKVLVIEGKKILCEVILVVNRKKFDLDEDYYLGMAKRYE